MGKCNFVKENYMAKKTQNKKESLPMEEMLWKACDALRGSIEPSEYKHVVLSLIFLKYAGFHFEKRRQEIIADGLRCKKCVLSA